MDPFVPAHLPVWAWAIYGIILVLACVGLVAIAFLTLVAREIKTPQSW